MEQLETVVVSATRLRSVADLDVPASVTTVQLDPDSNRAQTNVTEVLGGIPGVTALDRQNYAQDTQLSIRGFGARATFGVRGLRLYADGIPASMPDGQGQLSHFNLLGADRIQIMRGPFSALYGNSSGGVVQLWSRPGTEETSARAARHLWQLRRPQPRRTGAGHGRPRGLQPRRVALRDRWLPRPLGRAARFGQLRARLRHRQRPRS